MSFLDEIKKRKVNPEVKVPVNPLVVPKEDEVPLQSVPIYVCGLPRWGRLGLGEDMRKYDHPVPSRALHHQNVISVSCGAGHSYALVQTKLGDPCSNIVFSWGKCNFGQLGHNELEEDKNAPTHISAFDGLGIVSLGAGDAFGIAVTLKGEVYTWGCGYSGALGHGNEEHQVVPVKVQSLSGISIMKVDAGRAHTLALAETGEVYSWGNNKSGQLGINSSICKYLPQKITLLEGKKIVDIACGDSHSLCLDKEGIVSAFGSNSKGQLGIICEKSLVPIQVKLETAIISIGCGLDFSWAIDKDNLLWMWGDNIGGQLAVKEEPWNVLPHLVKVKGTPLEVAKVAATQYSTVCVTLNGKVYTWGDLVLWQDTVKGRTKPNSTLAIPRQEVSLNGRHVVDISCGCNHIVFAVLIDS